MKAITFAYLITFMWYDDSGKKWPSYMTTHGTFTSSPDTTYAQLQRAAINIAKDETNAQHHHDGSDVYVPEDAVVISFNLHVNKTAQEMESGS